MMFVGAWLLLLVGLFAYPGSEGRGLVPGLLIGLWPFLLLGAADFAHMELAIIGAVLLSGGFVGLCGWSADAARLSRGTWGLLLMAIVAGGAVSCALNDYSIEDWKNSPALSAAAEARSHEPSRQEYHESITIPKALAGAMWGLYVVAASSFVVSLCKFYSAQSPTRASRRGWPTRASRSG